MFSGIVADEVKDKREWILEFRGLTFEFIGDPWNQIRWKALAMSLWE